MRRFLFFTITTVIALLAGVVQPADAAPVVLRPPVEAEILDPFRLPEGPYGPGNRGIEYDTAHGDQVRAAGPGVVVFAGSVAGRVYVSIDHDGGLRTSYGPIAALQVGVGDTVGRGDRVGSAVGPLHFSTRIDGDYVDPAALFGELVVEVRLVPHDTDDRAAVDAAIAHGERLELLAIERARGGGGGVFGVIRNVVGGIADVVNPQAIVEGLVANLDRLLVAAEGLDPDNLAFELIAGLVEIVNPPPCTPTGVAAAIGPPAARRVAVVIDGLGSRSDDDGLRGELDFDALGYADDDIVRFSYEGGLTPGGGEAWADALIRTTYDDIATQEGLRPQIPALVDVLRAVRAANPGVPIDVYGHSAGGVIARHAIAEVHDEVGIGVAVTIAAPHQGTPAATFVEATMGTTPGVVIGEALSRTDPTSPLLAQTIDDLSETGFAADTAHVAFPEGVHAVTIGIRTDAVVPAREASAAGARHVVVGGLDPIDGHGALGLAAIETEARLAIAGRDPACTGTGDRILDLVVPEAIAAAERAATAGLLIADLPTGVAGGPSR